MGINWNNVIKNQMHGMDPASAFYKEERRMREENRKHWEEERQRRIEEREKRIEEHKKCQQAEEDRTVEEERDDI